MRINYIIIQAGGKGTRLKQLTRNKPKGIVPVDNLPLIYHLFRQYPDRRFLVVGDHRHEVLEEYLEAFPEVSCLTVKARGTGTCAGIGEAARLVPPGEPILVMWSDLILDQTLSIDDYAGENRIGLSEDFTCRWSFIDGMCVEKPSEDRGIAGFFLFKDNRLLRKTPTEGEFVRWLKEHAGITFSALPLGRTKEIGTMLAYEAQKKKYVCRPFNRMEIKGDIVIKHPVDEQGEKLALRERAWYREAQRYGFAQIPKIEAYEPLTMRKIEGENIFRANLTKEEKRIVIDRLTEALGRLHSFRRVPADAFSIMDAYYEKTVRRLARVRDLIPFADRKMIRINGRDYRNPYLYKSAFRSLVQKLIGRVRDFALIHGDCTFSNTMVDRELNVTFLDPRGYFGHTELYGDETYDWAKLWYSIEGDYDRFNNKEFTLAIEENGVELHIESNGWRDEADYYLSKIPTVDQRHIRFLHAVIWLSLTTYAWEDYDSICGAFYKGTCLMDAFLREEEKGA